MDDLRIKALQKWLTNSCHLQDFHLVAMPGDASFRRYFRVHVGNETYIAMVAPTERDDCKPYVAISRALREKGLFTPDIIHSHLAHGFLLISDLGDQQLLKAVTPENAKKLYSNALDALAVLQDCRKVVGWKIPPFTANFMYQELVLFKEWFLQTFLELELSSATEEMLQHFFRYLADTSANQPQVFMHRDYHSLNLMVLPEDQIGILDFQDAFMGPVTYDVVSLLRDCYIDLPDDLIKQLVMHYRDRLAMTVSPDELTHWFDMMGLQRHMKALLTFVRKSIRDGNSDYLVHIPRTLNYLTVVTERYSECGDFYKYLQKVIWPSFEMVSVPCVG